MTLQQDTTHAECTCNLFITLNVHMISSTSVCDQWNVKRMNALPPSPHNISTDQTLLSILAFFMKALRLQTGTTTVLQN